MNESHETDAHQLALQRTDWLLDAFVLAFGVWTLICHGVVFGGGSLRHVLWGAGLATVAAVVVAVAWVRRCRAKGAGPEALGASGPEAGPALSALTQRRRWVVGAGVLLLLLALVSWRAAAIWAASLVVLVFLFVDPPQDHCARRCSASRGTSVALAVLCLVGVVFTLSAVRFDLDDAFYVNLAVAAADQPGAPLMAYDTLHGVAGMPLLLPVYRAHSYELLVGAVASVLGTEPRPLVFVVFPAIAAVLLTLAQGRLCRALLPNRWIWALAVIVAILVCSGGAHRSYGDFAFARLQQGKAILVSVCVPLVVVYALEFMHAPSVWRWLRLCLIQCVAIGVSSTGLWLAPLVAGVVLASRAISLPSLRRALTGLTASAYVVAVGLSMRSEVIAIRALRGIGQGTSDAAPQTFGEFFAGGERLLGEAYGQVFHSGATGPALLVALLVLAGLSRSPQLRRLVLAFAVAFLAFWCPLTAHWIKQHLVPNYWRVFWILPAPFFVAAALTAPIEVASERLGRKGRFAVLALLLLVVGVASPSMDTLWEREPDAVGYRLARDVVERVPAGASVLVPLNASVRLPTLRRHPYPLIVRELYAKKLVGVLAPDDIEERLALTQLVGGSGSEGAGERLAEGIDRYGLQAVQFYSQAASSEELRGVLRGRGFERASEVDACELWVRSP